MAARFGDDEVLRARSYDAVAEDYERVNAPLLFDEPGRVLVEETGLRPGDRVLDAGTGTGAVARAAIARIGSDAVVALDPSLPMLAAAGRGGVVHLVAGALPGLPFHAASFDAVFSAFVMTHVEDPDAAVRDIARVLRPRGCVVLSAWAPSDDAYSRTWSDTVDEFVARDVLVDAANRVLPGEARFSRPDGLAALLSANGFASVRTGTHTFRFALGVEDLASSREVSATGRALRTLLSDAGWRSCQARVRGVLGNKFPEGARFDRGVFIAIGTKQ